MRVLIVNTGSTSVKLRLLGSDDALLGRCDFPVVDGTIPVDAMTGALEQLGAFDAVGHRVVHGGTVYRSAVRVDDTVLQQLQALVELAPLHQPQALAAIDLLRTLLPGVPQVACFDTTFHTTVPEVAATYALPASWRDRFQLRRYGFHGLSHAYASRRAAELVGGDPGRVVTAHLGAGASLAAVRHGQCVDTTMGFTPLEGLVMATRPGDVDPGLVLWLLRDGRLSFAEVDRGLTYYSGLAGLGGAADIRTVVAQAEAGDAAARLALDVYVYRLRSKIAAMAAALGGLDTLVFTGGVGENQPLVRSGAAAGLGFLGVRVDEDADRGAEPDAEVTGDGSRVRVFVVAAREDLQIAAETRNVVA
ncbi:acetate kinase [Thermobifida fusca]|jgi:acetate kinase|nr:MULTISPECIES: acetate/propionate family kinase [Thermobifida]AAZ57004.1 acetate kinase [Thermobifida fusca YX]MBO2530055.1 acetate/propionate family kinase [Thermobifida sp.]MDD6790665.1 acetate/propionate family kinase [Thermobifida fusca]PPS95023.1 acetate kinase [Thermobifida fusca]PZN65742.1 MAG: acetate/propionate family kinase [Thermobifida fusca]